MCKTTAKNYRATKNSGAFLILLCFLLVLLLGAVIFAVDMPRRDNAGTQLRVTLDMSVLAAVEQIDGTLSGLRAAKNVIEHTIERNRDEFDGGAQISFNKDQDIAFGFYSKVTCINLPTGCTSARCRACDAEPDQDEIFFFEELKETGTYYGIPASAVINAVKVKADVKVDGSFSNVFMSENTGLVTVKSSAVTDQKLEECVFPLAIPACHLFLNTNPNDLDNLTVDEFSPRDQCPREIIFSESSLWDPWVYETRGLGYQRAMTTIDLENISNLEPKTNRCGMMTGEGGPNCMMQTIPGVLAVPREFGDDHKASADELIAAFQKMAGQSDPEKACIRVSIGSHLKPIDNSTDDNDGLLTGFRVLPDDSDDGKDDDDLAPISDFLATPLEKLLTDAQNPLFSEVFGDPLTLNAKPNYPYQRSGLHRLLRWPDYSDEKKILLDDMGKWEWTAPLCHNPKIPANDKQKARVREVKVMLIVPGTSFDPQNEETPYCHFASQFEGGSLVAWPPYSETEPRVVGFMKVNLFDFNFSNLSSAAAGARGGKADCTIDGTQGLYDENCVSQNVLGGLSDGGPLGLKAN